MKRIFAAMIVLALAGCTTSSAIMTGQARAAKPASDVRVYLRPPAKFESIALVSAMSNAAVSRDGSREKAVAELQRKAGELGANKIISNLRGMTYRLQLCLCIKTALPFHAASRFSPE